MGLRRIEEKITQEAALKVKGSQLALRSLEDMSKKIRELHKELQQLEAKYTSDIKKNPNLAQEVMKLRSELGLPLAIGIYEVGSKPSLKSRLQGKDEYENYLALRILEIGKKTKNRTGGILSVSELILQINDESKGIVVSINDVTNSLKLLSSNGLVHQIRVLAGMKIVEFMDPQLTDDHQIILEIAAEDHGQISLTTLVQKTAWTMERVERALSVLTSKKIAIRSNTLDGVVLSFPGIG
jgi:regulator of replication initiation timing